jgi:hypothetical protein
MICWDAQRISNERERQLGKNKKEGGSRMEGKK